MGSLTGRQPFWRERRLDELSRPEWEALCDGCGRCCVFRLEDEDTGACADTNVCCDLLDGERARCRSYADRAVRQPMCITLTAAMVLADPSWLPGTCAYRLLAEGRELRWWHPLVSGDPRTVLEAGISVRGRVVPEAEAGDLEDHIVPGGWLD